MMVIVGLQFRINSQYHDEASRFVHLLTAINPSHSSSVNKSAGVADCSRTEASLNQVNGVASKGRLFLAPEDFVPLVQDVVDTHPGLTFLKEATEFHSRYVHTVKEDGRNNISITIQWRIIFKCVFVLFFSFTPQVSESFSSF